MIDRMPTLILPEKNAVTSDKKKIRLRRKLIYLGFI